MDQVVVDVLDAVERQDWSTVRLLLHPYLHWTQDGVVVRGRTKITADRP
ncbi:hypothetical protein GCM10010464_88890 [Pseudonocardia yunnanensis]|uniref:Nuclear transport factor 2 family protein n=1 Tax=Pseudonocardia yunnanensis TaxID=58107 RepID=A0ABW4FA96_9PSEU